MPSVPDMMMNGQDIDYIAYGDSAPDDRFPDHRFDYTMNWLIYGLVKQHSLTSGL